MSTKLLFIGSCVSELDDKKMASQYFRKNFSVSNLVYERKLFQYAKENALDFCFISAPSVRLWPKQSKKIWVRGFTNEDRLLVCSYCVFPAIAHLSKYLAIRKRLKQFLKSVDPNDTVHIVAFEAHSPYLRAVRYCKKHASHCFSTLVVPDLPEDLRRDTKDIFYFLLKKWDIKNIAHLRKRYVDSYVFFTKAMESRINDPDKPFFVSNGLVVQNTNLSDAPRKNAESINCVYVGKTTEENGVQIIIDAAKKAKDGRIVYHVYGSGSMDDALREETKKNSALCFHGFLEPGSVGEVLKGADVFLALRLPDSGDYLNYSFPSKILEYLPFGKPIIALKLPCFDEKYDSAFTYLPDTDGNTLNHLVLQMSENSHPTTNQKLIDSLSPAHWFSSLAELRGQKNR